MGSENVLTGVLLSSLGNSFIIHAHIYLYKVTNLYNIFYDTKLPI